MLSVDRSFGQMGVLRAHYGFKSREQSMQVGFKPFAEAYSLLELVGQAVQTEQAVVDFGEMSDHFHPWLDQAGDFPVAGHSGCALSVLVMIAARTSRIRLGTGITCPTVRYHPAIIAQAAATMGILVEDGSFSAPDPANALTSTWSVRTRSSYPPGPTANSRPTPSLWDWTGTRRDRHDSVDVAAAVGTTRRTRYAQGKHPDSQSDCMGDHGLHGACTSEP